MDKLSLYTHKLNITVRFSDLDAMGYEYYSPFNFFGRSKVCILQGGFKERAG